MTFNNIIFSLFLAHKREFNSIVTEHFVGQDLVPVLRGDDLDLYTRRVQT